MYCPNCGTFIDGNVAFCTSCGAATTPSAAPEQASAGKDGFPDPTVLPTPEQGRINPRELAPEMTPDPWRQDQEIDINSMVSDLSEPEPEPESSNQSFTDEDMAWFTDHQTPEKQQTPYPKPTTYSQPTSYPQPTQYPQQQSYPQQGNIPQSPYPQQLPPGFVPPVPVDLTPRKSNVLLGIIGAVVFSLIGCVIWIIIGSFGYVSYLGGLALSLLTVTGYKLLGKKFDIYGVITCLIVVALAVFVSNIFINAFMIASDEELMEIMGYLGYNNFSDIFLRFFDMVRDVDEILASVYPGESGLMQEFFSELGIGYVFAGIAFIVVAVSQYRASKNI